MNDWTLPPPKRKKRRYRNKALGKDDDVGIPGPAHSHLVRELLRTSGLKEGAVGG
jgi:hypothetical protein